MELITAITNRQSCRDFDAARAVAREDIVACLEAARLAPSATNSQPWHFTVCRGQLAADAAAATQSMGMNKFTSAAPCLIVVSEESYNLSGALGSRVKKQDFRSVDIGIATAHLTLAATARGLSTCILGWFDEKQLQKLLQIKARIRLVIALGYAAADDPLRPKKRKPLEEIVTFANAE